MLRIRYQHPTGAKLGVSVERLADGALLDFADSTFKATPGKAVADLPEDSGIFSGRYKANLPTPPGEWRDGDYCVTVHSEPNQAAGIADVVAELYATIHAGDDASVFPLTQLPPGTYPFAVGGFTGTFTVPPAPAPAK